jgi:hypothetical protein
VNESDCALFVFSPDDDKVMSRDDEQLPPRGELSRLRYALTAAGVEKRARRAA